MPELYLMLQIAGAMLSLDLIIYLFFRWDCIERKTLIVLFADIFIFNMVNVLAYMLPEGWMFRLGNYIYTGLELVFIVGITVIIISMSEYPLPKKLIAVESLYFIILYLMLLTNHHHHLFFQKQDVSEINGRRMLKETPGIFSYMFQMGFLLVMAALFVFALFVYVKRKSMVQRSRRAKMRLLVIGTVIPLVGSILYITGWLEESAAASLSMLIEGIIVMFSLNKYHFLDVIQNARDLVVDTMKMALIIVDEEFYYLDSNPYAKTIFPRLAELAEGSSLPEQMWEIYQLFQEEHTTSLAIGERYYEYQVSQVFDQGRMRGYALCIYDVTKQQKYMNQLVEMRRKAERENEEKSQFLANASHEIRTPMNVILGMSEISLHKSLDPEMEYVVKSIYNAGKGLLDMINGILDFSKMEAGRMELQEAPYSLEKILMDMANMVYTKLYQQPVEFSLEVGQKVPLQLLGDGSKIRIILTNLLGNAMKYTEQGKILLSVEGTDLEAGEVELLFRVEDTGTGMCQEDAVHIFENYTQVGEYTQAREKGTGLGLAITKRMVELMKGTIGVESQVGKGTSFAVTVRQKSLDQRYLPSQKINRFQVVAWMKREMTVEKMKTAYPGMEVLVVDDMETNARVAAGLLSLYQVQSDIAGSAQEAFQMMEKKPYDLLFLDQMMPGMDGAAMAEQIQKKQSWDQAPMIALTANRGRENEAMLKSSGFDEVLEKPIEKQKLEQILAEYLGQRRKKRVEVYRAYVRELNKMCSQLEEQLRENLEDFIISVHGIKGASRNVGMLELGDLAEQLELAGRNKETEIILDKMPEFMRLRKEAEEKAEKEIRRWEFSEEKQLPYRDGPKLELLKNLQEALENFQLDQAEEIIEELQKYQYPPRKKEFLDTLQEDIANLDYEIAAERINEGLKCDIWK